MRLHRLRIELDDTPGALGRVAAALGDLGVNILDVDVLDLGTSTGDDLLIDLTQPIDLGAVEYAVVDAGCAVVSMQPADHHEMVDSITRCLHVAAALRNVESAADHSEVADVARTLVRADDAWVGHPPAFASSSVAGRATGLGSPQQDREPMRGCGSLEGTWTLAIPCALDQRPRLLTLIRSSHPFSTSEIARLSALVDLAMPATDAQRPSRAAHPTAGTPARRGPLQLVVDAPVVSG